MRQTERRSSKYSTRSFKMMSQMTCCKCWVKLVCLVMLLLKIQPSGVQGLADLPPLINYPPFLTSHTLELRKINIEGEEDVQEGEYELQGIAGGDDEGERQIKWVLGLYFITRDEDIWQGGVVLNGGGGKGLHWVRLIAVSGGRERILGEQMCHNKSQSQLPSLTLAVSFQSTEGEAVKQNCEMIKVSHGPLHPLQLRASTDGLENVMEADFDFHPSSASNITRMVFYFYNTKHNRQEARVVMISLKQGNNHNISDILGVKVIGYKSNTTTNPWTQKTSKMITPLSVKFQVGPFGVRVKETTAGQSRVVIETKKSLAFGVRVKETTAGQPRVVTETNRSLALSRHLRLGVGCWGNETDCGYVSYSCMKKMGMILNCPSEPNTKKSKFYQKLLSLVLMVTFGVAVVIMLQCLHQLNIILHHLPNTLY
ncbi:hypothetical protein Pcinc_005028 [Petrolisthes cinctipes]|uniref:Uncharacterized protein n=1 Tax=Petrolisthes cinctipes TaxID=88211 RepID=A0AAE1GK94_PETCI|nr:hypothetical protein Pcinc_005028 [Petrolisthes cinctipes]